MKTTFFLIPLVALSSVSLAQVSLNHGLLAHYPFSGNANDASGNGNHGTPMNGIQLTTDKFGNPNSAYKFDGVDDHIFLSDNGKLSPKSITVAAWVYPESSSAQSITGKIDKASGNHSTYHIGINYDIQAGFFWGLAPPNSNCFRQIPYNPNNPFLTSPEFFSINTWHCVVGTFQDSVQKLYIDGVLVQSKKYNFKNLDQCTNTNFLIGRWWDGDPIPFKGKIDEVRIYDRELNTAEVSALCGPVRPCDTWLNLPSNPSFVKVGDLDVSGNKLTIEAVINRTTPYTGGPLWAGDIVSKHTQPTDANYLLRPNSAEITTTNGYFKTPDICAIDLNKNYHVAMVYDGSFLKFYRNGFLMSQVAASGNLYQNDFETRIGWYWLELYQENFIGYINEVRIWNIARTQTELRTYMSTSLPSPAAQAGLLAYYVFDNLLNKQGNIAWNGTLSGMATINATNPECPNFTVDSCCAPLTGTLTGSNICVGGTGTLTINSFSGLAPYTITYTDGSSIHTAHNVQNGVAFDVVGNPIRTTTYNLLSIKDASSCGATSLSGISASIVVDSNSNAADSIHSTSNDVCGGTNVLLTVMGGSLATNASWQWYTNSCGGTSIGSGGTLQVTPSIGTKYFVRAEGSCNTTNCVSLDIKVLSPVIEFDSIPDVCADQLDFQIMQAREISGLNGTGYFTGNGVSSSGIFSPSMAGAGTHIVTFNFASANGCSGFKSRSITVNTLPRAEAGNDILLCAGEDAQFNSSGGVSYSWWPVTGLNNASIANPILKTNTAGTYFVTVTDSEGCKAVDSIHVFVTTGGKESFKIANAFTPNNDGRNDCFGIGNLGNVDIREFSIFNRWGQKVFSSTNASDCWDGTVKGIKQDEGGYVYLMRANTSCGEVVLKGVVTLIR
jgi:gliding motility-associated-like protein